MDEDEGTKQDPNAETAVVGIVDGKRDEVNKMSHALTTGLAPLFENDDDEIVGVRANVNGEQTPNSGGEQESQRSTSSGESHDSDNSTQKQIMEDEKALQLLSTERGKIRFKSMAVKAQLLKMDLEAEFSDYHFQEDCACLIFANVDLLSNEGVLQVAKLQLELQQKQSALFAVARKSMEQSEELGEKILGVLGHLRGLKERNPDRAGVVEDMIRVGERTRDEVARSYSGLMATLRGCFMD